MEIWNEINDSETFVWKGLQIISLRGDKERNETANTTNTNTTVQGNCVCVPFTPQKENMTSPKIFPIFKMRK